MKTSVLLGFAVLAVMASCAQGQSVKEFRDMIGPLARECQSEAKATDEDVDKLLNRKSLDTPTAKCLQKCVYHKIGVMKDNGVTDLVAWRKVYTTVYKGNEERLKKTEQVLDECSKKAAENKDKDICELAAVLQKCVSDIVHEKS